MLEQMEAWLERRAARRQRKLDDDASFEYSPDHDKSAVSDAEPSDISVPLWAWIGLAFVAGVAVRHYDIFN